MKHSLKIVILAVAIASVCSWNSIKVTKQSDSLALQNIEALATGEVMGGVCEGSWSKECCVCGIKHYTFAAVVDERECESRSGCAHFNDPKDK